MQRRSITWRVLTLNLLIVLVLAVVTVTSFGFVARRYMEQNVMEQLVRLAERAEVAALGSPVPALLLPGLPPELEMLSFYFDLNRTFRETLTVLNADYILLDAAADPVVVLPSALLGADPSLKLNIASALELPVGNQPNYGNVEVGGEKYAVVVKQLPRTSPWGVRWLVVYSSLAKLNEMEMAAYKILAVILLGGVLLSMVVSLLLVKRISAPFAVLTKHIQAIAARDFGGKIDFPVDAELAELVGSINSMSEKLEHHDEAQKTFLQNASHDFRTPLMAIGSYAEGIMHKIVEPEEAAGVILDETQRLAHMVEDLLYLSRLTSIEESYDFGPVSLGDVLQSSAAVVQGLAAAHQKQLTVTLPAEKVLVTADEDKLVRAVVNILDNCLRYAEREVTLSLELEAGEQVKIVISDDGPGIPPQDLPHIFTRFFKGAGGQVGLGLAIAASIIERHGGAISAANTSHGAVFTIILPSGR